METNETLRFPAPFANLGRPDDAYRRARELGVEDLARRCLEYLEERHPLGGFLTAVLENDLSGAVGRADSRNLGRIPALVTWLWNYFPSHAWGSPEKVARFLAPEEEGQDDG